MWSYATRDVRTVPSTGTLRDVIQLMATGGFRHLPVVDGQGALVGIVSDRDVRRLLPSPGTDPREVDRSLAETRVVDVMTRDPITLHPDASMIAAIEKVLEHRVGALPILREGRLVGILTRSDILRAFADTLGRSETLHIEETPPAYMEPGLDAEDHVPLLFLLEPSERLRRHLAALLAAAGVNVTSFATLAELTAHDGLETPDLILLSASASGVDADPLEVLRAGYPTTPVVITREGTPRREERRGGKGPLFLPCSAEALLARVWGEIGFARWTHDLPVWTAPSRLLRTGTIDIDIDVARPALVVDQDPLTRKIVGHHLRSLGCDVTEAADGEEAKALLASGGFELVTVELDLPLTSGFELLELARACPTQPRVVVIASARRDEDVRASFELGAADFIKKPLAPQVFVARILRALE